MDTGEGGGLACGNGVMDPGEACDDGNGVMDDGCTNACALPACGDGVVQGSAGEQCDDGGQTGGDGCLADCRRPGGMLVQVNSDTDYEEGWAVAVGGGQEVYFLGSGVGYDVVRLDGALEVVWQVGASWSARLNLELADGNGVIVGGQEKGLAFARVVEANGDLRWSGAVFDDKTESMILAVASGGGQLVAAGRRDIDEGGVLVRLDGAGMATSTITADAPLGPVGVDAMGRVWVIEQSDPPRLLNFSSTDEPGKPTPLAPGVYEDLLVEPSGGSVVLLAHAADDSSFRVTKLDADGFELWSSPYVREGATARGFTRIPDGSLVIAGHASDRSHGVIDWVDAADGSELYHLDNVRAGDQALSFFNDVAVAPTGEFGVAVGGAGAAADDTSLWVYEFEI